MALLNFPLSLAQFLHVLPVADMTFSLSEALVSDETGRGEVLTAAIGARLWTGSVTVVPQRLDLSGRYSALLDLIRQPGATFFIGDVARRGPAGDPTGALLGAATPTLSAVSTDRRQLTVAGLPPGYALGPGDYLSLNYGSSPVRRALHRIVFGGGVANSAGLLPSVEIIPPVRNGFTIGAAVTLVNPACKAVILPGTATPSRARRGLGDGLSFGFIQTLS